MSDEQRIKITRVTRTVTKDHHSGTLSYDQLQKLGHTLAEEDLHDWRELPTQLDNAASENLDSEDVQDSEICGLVFEGPGIYVDIEWQEEGGPAVINGDTGLEKLLAILRGEHHPLPAVEGPEYGDLSEQAKALMEEFGGSIWDTHPDYLTEDWTDEVINGNTRLGYWEWVANEINNDYEGD